MTTMLNIYHRLPAPVRSAAATLRGFYLRRWRYGPESERLAEAAIERDNWSAAQWRAWREQRLAWILHRAATRVPYYRLHWAARRRHGDRVSWEYLEHWAPLEKDRLRDNPRMFVADDCDPRRMLREQTSGTTGKPLDIWRSRPTYENLYAIADARTERWHGIPHGARWARLGGQLVTPVRQRRPPFWVWNAAMHQLYMSSYHLAPDLVPHYLDALRRYRITFLAAYPSSLLSLAQEALRLGRTDLRMLAVFTNAEPLTTEQREVIGQAFQCRVLETYGMTESVAAASECEASGLHQWPEIGHIEVWDENGPIPHGQPGEFLCTGLLNADMPLIRYRVGDRGRLALDSAPCACGRSLPRITEVEGRTSDQLVTPDGRMVFWLNPVFYGLPIRQSQIVQESLTRVRVKVAPAPEFRPQDERTIAERLRDRLGEVAVHLERVTEIPRTANGKVRAVVCNLSPEERAQALQSTRRPEAAMS